MSETAKPKALVEKGKTLAAAAVASKVAPPITKTSDAKEQTTEGAAKQPATGPVVDPRDVYFVDWKGLDGLDEALKYVGFDAPELRKRLLADSSTTQENLLKLIITYLNVGNAVDRLADRRKVKDLEKAKNVTEVVKQFRVKKGKGAGSYTLSQIAQALMPVTLLLACKYRKLNDVIFKPFFSGVPEFDEEMKKFEEGVSAYANSKRKEGEKAVVSSTDWVKLQRDGMMSDPTLIYYLYIAAPLAIDGDYNSILFMLDLLLNGEQVTGYDLGQRALPRFSSGMIGVSKEQCKGLYWDLTNKTVKEGFSVLYKAVMQKAPGVAFPAKVQVDGFMKFSS